MKKHYQGRIGDLKTVNQRAIDKLLKEFHANMVKVEGEYVDSRHTSKHLQEVYDKQLERMELSHEEQVVEIKQHHAEDRQRLKE